MQPMQKVAKIGKAKREFGNYIYIYIIIIIILLLASSCVSLRYFTLAYNLHAILYARFFHYFYNVKKCKAQHMQQKRHSKKPLQFCNMKKTSNINNLQNLGCAFFAFSILGITFQQHAYNLVTIMYT